MATPVFRVTRAFIPRGEEPYSSGLGFYGAAGEMSNPALGGGRAAGGQYGILTLVIESGRIMCSQERCG
jgi:hypothetical protein